MCSTSSVSRSLTARLDAALTLDRGRQRGCRPALLRRLLRGQPSTMAGPAGFAGAAAVPRAASPRDGGFVRGRLYRGSAAGTRRIRGWRRGQRDDALRLLERSQRAGRRRLAAGVRQYPPPLVAWPAAHGDGAATGRRCPYFESLTSDPASRRLRARPDLRAARGGRTGT